MYKAHKITLLCLGVIIILLGVTGCSPESEAVSNKMLPILTSPLGNSASSENSPTATSWLITRTPLPSPVESASPFTLAPSKTETPAHSLKPALSPTLETTPTTAPTPAAVDWTEAGKYVGEQRVVCGPVAGTHYASSSRGKPTFLNIGEDYPSPRRFVVLIWGEYRRNFPEPPESLYLDKNICVSGVITEYKGIFEIEIRSPEEITVR